VDLNGVISEHLARGEKGAVAIIIEKTGAAPRDEGARMFVTSLGKSYGTIGGGSVEARAIREAMEVITTGQHSMLDFRMDGKNVADNDMICGGNVRIFIEPVDAEQKDVYVATVNAMKRSRKGFLITRYSSSGTLKSLACVDGTVVGAPVDQDMLERLFAVPDKPVVSDGFIAMPIVNRSDLYIFGAGHVSQYISRVAAMVGFDVTVIDDRRDYANSERFPEARTIIVDEFHSSFDYLPFTGSEYVVIVTRGHKHDALILEQVITRPTRYLGMIGSRRKTRMVFDHLKKNGIDDSQLVRVFAPIGINIAAETPEEIAVSIMAEIIQVRHQPEYRRHRDLADFQKWGISHHAPDHHKVLFG
jgi:xanthine dehydrogenase accessory factor